MRYFIKNHRHTSIHASIYCIVLHLYIYTAPLAVHTNQKRFQCERPKEKSTYITTNIYAYICATIHTYMHIYIHIQLKGIQTIHEFINSYIIYVVGRGWVLVEGHGSEGSWVRLPLYPPRRELGQVLHSQSPVALRREIPAQCPCCVGSASEQQWTWIGAIEIV